MEEVVLVDRSDAPIGTMEKLEAHKQGLLHRAFSVFVFNSNRELMLQRRALHKYHSGGLWTNTCCSHPRPGELVEAAAHRRLEEEMGFDCTIDFAFHFIYEAHLDQNLVEHELDHVFTGTYDGPVHPNPDEVAEVRFISMEQLHQELQTHPEQYTEWFKIAVPMLQEQNMLV